MVWIQAFDAFFRSVWLSCFTYVPQVIWAKLDKKTIPGIFIGYSNVTKTYKIFQHEGEKIVITEMSTSWRIKNGIGMTQGIPSRKQGCVK